ncbi:1-deoxy-D-xylulose-5-phosphate synthase [Veillonella atypica]|uniref:1-deoxy-D-xylulose-5-phosphate synthase n=1 Tax=Veillonella atypica TaxID=39777 RepID=UPI003992250B
MELTNIQIPSDLRDCSIAELEVIAQHIRNLIIHRTSHIGGHIGSSLGATDIIVALHHVFGTDNAQFVFDISHQSYAHKILTGRHQGFIDENQFHTVSGYSNPDESTHDPFHLGHASTSLSLTAGLMIGRDLQHKTQPIVTMIGDGALSGGEAYEALNHLATMSSQCLIIINDNEQSIAENHGGLYSHLQQLRDTHGESPNNLFKALGFSYRYVDDGNSLESLIHALKNCKDETTPTVLHIHTTKGHGYDKAIANPEGFHNPSGFDIDTGETKKRYTNSYESIVAKQLIETLDQNKAACIVTAATPGGFCLTKDIREKLGAQYIDVGIAEEHATTLLAGIAHNGGTPILPIYSTFLQRAYDQIINDLCINNSNALILVYRASIYGNKDMTHLGFNDISMLGNMPNLMYLAPTTVEELESSIRYGLEDHNHPIAIRIPVGVPINDTAQSDTIDKPVTSYAVTQSGNTIAIIGIGNFYHKAVELSHAIRETTHISPTIIKPLCISSLDTDTLNELTKDHHIVITLEDGELEGGYGQKIASYYGKTSMKVLNYGISKQFYDRYKPEDVLQQNHLDFEHILDDIRNVQH